MQRPRSSRARSTFVWLLIACVLIVPFAAATASPLLQWREPIYVIAGFSGIVALAVLLVQPLLASQLLPGIPPSRARRLHRWIGGVLVAAVVVHVAALWITSPPDVVDALLLRSPTWFSIWGVIAMWAVFATGLIAALRPRFSLRVWRLLHMALALIIASSTIAHALLIEGTMEVTSKAVLCALVAAATFTAALKLKYRMRKRRS